MANQKITELVDQKAFDQIERLKAELVGLIDIISKAANQPGVMNPQTAQTIAQANKNIKEYTGALVALENAQKRSNAANDQAPGSLRAMRSEMELLRRKLDEVNLETKEGAKQAEEYRRRIADLKRTVKENGDELSNQRANVGNYKSAWEGVKGALIAIGAAIAAAAGAIRFGSEVIASSEALSDKWQKTTQGLTNAWGVFKNAIATLDFSNLITNLNNAIKLGEEYAELLDLLEDKRRGAEVSEAQSRLEISKLKIIVNNVQLEKDVRIKAARDIIAIEVANSEKRIEIATQNKEALEKVIVGTKGLNKETLQGFIEFKAGSEEQLEAVNKYNAALDRRNGYIAKLTLQNRQLTIEERDVISRRLAAVNKELGLATDNTIKLDTVTKKISPKEITDLKNAYIELATSQALKYENQEALQRRISRLNKGLIDDVSGITDTTDDQITEQKKQQENTVKINTSALTEIKTTNTLIDSLDELARARKKAAEANDGFDPETLPFMSDKLLKKEFDNLDEEKKRIEERDKMIAASAEERNKMIAASANAALDIYRTISDAKFANDKAALDNEMAQLQAQYDKKLISEAQYQKQREVLEQRDRKLRHDKAVRDKEIALFQAAINIAVAITDSLKTPWMTAIVAAIGAAQMAAIIAQPIPKYEKGRKGGRAEWAEVHPGEIVTSGGSAYFTPDTPALTYLPQGASVIPRPEVELLKQMAFSGLTVNEKGKAGIDLTKLIESNQRGDDAIVQAVKSIKTEKEVKIKGLYDSMAWNAYVEQNFRR